MKTVKSDGVMSFEVTDSNNMKLRALIVYAQVLDYVVSQTEKNAETLNADAVINSLLDDITDKRIKELVKRHGFESDNEFIEVVGACRNAEEALSVIKEAEISYYKASHEHILSQVPFDDKQLKLSFDKGDKQ